MALINWINSQEVLRVKRASLLIPQTDGSGTTTDGTAGGGRWRDGLQSHINCTNLYNAPLSRSANFPGWGGRRGRVVLSFFFCRQLFLFLFLQRVLESRTGEEQEESAIIQLEKSNGESAYNFFLLLNWCCFFFFMSDEWILDFRIPERYKTAIGIVILIKFGR